jgi:hypothetical protein
MNFIITHIYREGNSLAVKLASMALVSTGFAKKLTTIIGFYFFVIDFLLLEGFGVAPFFFVLVFSLEYIGFRLKKPTTPTQPINKQVGSVWV